MTCIKQWFYIRLTLTALKITKPVEETVLTQIEFDLLAKPSCESIALVDKGVHLNLDTMSHDSILTMAAGSCGRCKLQ